MAYLGDISLGQTLDFNFTTRQISGAPSTLSSSPVLSCYVGNSTTEITAGITLSVDFDSRTGMNHVRIVASGGNGYATASDYSVVITTGTVNSVSVVGEVVADFSIENRQTNVRFWNGTAVATPATAGIPEVNVKNWNNLAAVALPLVPTTAGRTLDVSAGGEAGLDWANVGSPTTTLGLSGTTVKAVTDAVALPASATIAITGNITGNLSGSVGSVTGAVGSVAGAVGSVTGAVGSVTGAVGSVTGNVGGNVTGSVGSVVGLTASNLDTTVSSRSTYAGGAVSSVTGNVGGNVVGSVASVTANVNADVKKINGVTIVGDGSGTPFNV